MTAPGYPRTALLTQWLALSRRSVLGGIRDNDLLFSFFAPAVFFVCFYVPLRRMMDLSGIGYAQYLLPVIVLQSMLFTAMAASDRAAGDNLSGMGIRFRSLPIASLAPLAARMSANMTRAAVSIAGSCIIGYAFGFRFEGAITHALLFIGLALLFGLSLSFGADALGTVSTSREGASQALLIPQLLLTMLSTGFLPAESFPGWIQPFVRNQPVSQVAAALHEIASGTTTSQSIWIALAWCAGLLAGFAALALHLDRKER